MSRILEDKIEIDINGKKYFSRLDMLCVSEMQLYMKLRGTPMKVQDLFEEIKEENYFIICNMLIFAIKSCNPSLKMIDLFYEMKFVDRVQLSNELIKVINASLPLSDDDKKKDQEEEKN